MIHWNTGKAPEPPFIASIFNYYLSDDLEGYQTYDELTLELAKRMPGFLGYESFKHEGRGSFISYWKDMEAVHSWAAHPDHIEAKKKGKSTWYRYYHSVIAEVTSLHLHQQINH
jgi:heme-degrading monooxygenase HmoA